MQKINKDEKFKIILWDVNKNALDLFSFSFSQFYGRAHNAKAFLKCASLDSMRNLVRMIWF